MTSHCKVEGWPAEILDGSAEKELMTGAVASVTVTVTLSVAEPEFPTAVSVYTVVAGGDTVFVAEKVTVPVP